MYKFVIDKNAFDVLHEKKKVSYSTVSSTYHIRLHSDIMSIEKQDEIEMLTREKERKI